MKLSIVRSKKLFNLFTVVCALNMVSCDKSETTYMTQPTENKGASAQKVFVNNGERTGSGGDAFVCKNSRGEFTKIRLWDYLEAEIENDALKIDLGPEDLSYKEKIKIVIERIKKKNIQHFLFQEMEDLLTEVNKMESDDPKRLIRLIDLKNFQLSNIQDDQSRIVSKTESCGLLQMAMQEHQERPFEGLIKIDKSLWDKLSNDDKAGLILHEYFLLGVNVDKNREDKSSYGVRYLNRIVSSDLMEKISEEDFHDVLSATGLIRKRSMFYQDDPTSDYEFKNKNLYFNLYEIEEYEYSWGRKEIVSGWIMREANYYYEINSSYDYFTIRQGTKIEFYPENEQLKQASLKEESYLPTTIAYCTEECENPDQVYRFEGDGYITHFHDSFPLRVKTGYLSANQIIKVNPYLEETTTFKTEEVTQIEFHEDGTVKSLHLFGNLNLPNNQTFVVIGLIEFFDSGNIQSAYIAEGVVYTEEGEIQIKNKKVSFNESGFAIEIENF